MSTPSRRVALFSLQIKNGQLLKSDIQFGPGPLVNNGYGPVYTGLFSSGDNTFVALMSPEGNLLKTDIVSALNPTEILASDVLVMNGARVILGPDIQPFDENKDGQEELLVPFATGEVYSLYPGLSSLISYSNGKHLIISEFCISPSESKDVLLNPLYKIGYENNIYKKVKLQIGYSSIKSFSLGFSLDYKNKFFSYSFSPNFNNIILGHDHQFSILLDLPNN